MLLQDDSIWNETLAFLVRYSSCSIQLMKFSAFWRRLHLYIIYWFIISLLWTHINNGRTFFNLCTVIKMLSIQINRKGADITFLANMKYWTYVYKFKELMQFLSAAGSTVKLFLGFFRTKFAYNCLFMSHINKFF